MSENVLVLVRHGESKGNAGNTFTGWLDLGLTERGRVEARSVGKWLCSNGISFDTVFTSALTRCIESSRLLIEELADQPGKTQSVSELNERDYGQLSGLNKDEARARWGEQQVRLWRRSYAIAPPDGESLRDVVARTAPFYVRSILPAVLRGEHALVVTHGNVLRALSMLLDGHTPETIPTVEFATGEALVYRLAADATVLSRKREMIEMNA